jgi:hypothetical protein
MRKHFVTFMSPGTLFAETTTKEIGEWDAIAAMKMVTDVQERYGAIPYGFRFETRIVHDPVPDGEGGTLDVADKTVATSGVHYIKGTILRYDQVSADQTGAHNLLSNMRCNGWPLVVETRNGFKWTAPFGEEDAVVNADGVVTARGNDADLAKYRTEMVAAWEREFAAA